MIRLSAFLGVLLLYGSPAWGRFASPNPTASLAGAEAAGLSALARIGAGFGVVTSTFRTPAHNRAVGGATNSYHLRGQAIDIVRRIGVTHSQIEAALLGAGLRLIESLDEGDHSHFAFGQMQAPPIKFAKIDKRGRSGVTAEPLAVETVIFKRGPATPSRLVADEHGVLQPTNRPKIDTLADAR